MTFIVNKIQISLFLSILLLASIYLIPGLGGIISILLAIILILIYLLYQNRFVLCKNNLTIYLIFFVFITYVIMIIVSQPLRHYPLIFDDIEFIILFIKDFLLLYVFSTLFIKEKEKIFKYIVFFSFISSIICLIQFSDLLGINKLLLTAITTEKRAAEFEIGHIRAIGLAVNPNVAAYLNSFGCIFSFSIFFYNKRIKYLIIGVFIFIFGIITTGSRSGIFSFLLSLLFVFYLYFIRNKNIFVKLKFISLIFIIVFASLIIFINLTASSDSAAISRILRLQNIDELVMHESSSLAIRLYYVAPKLLEDWLRYPILGNGIVYGDESLLRYGDIGYLYYLRVFGVIGFSIMCMLFLWIFYRLSKERKKALGNYYLNASLGFFILIFTGLLSQELDLGKISPLFWTIIGLCLNNTKLNYMT